MRCVVLLAAVCACGDNRSPGATGDAAVTDGSPDGRPDAPPDARDPTVRVRVPPIIPPSVLFLGPDNQPLPTTGFDADGIATAQMPDGGTVIVVPDPLGSLGDLRAIFGVVPGDDLNLIPVVDVIGGDHMTVSVTARPNTDTYRVYSRCGDGGSGTTTIDALVDNTCPVPQAMLVHAEDQTLHLLGAFRDVSPSITNATLSGTYLDPITMSVTVSSTAAFDAPLSFVSPVIEGRKLRYDSFGVLGATTATTKQLDYVVDPGSLVDARNLSIITGRPSAPNRPQQFERRIAASATAVAFDFDAAELPTYTIGSYTPATRTVAWTRTATGAPLAGQLISFHFENFDAGLVHTWRIVVPANVTEVALPVLPGGPLDEFDPNRPFVDTYQVIPMGVRSSSYSGYDDFRRNVTVTHEVGSTFDTSTVSAAPI